MKRLAALALLCGGCLQGVPDDINCIGDDTCPTGYYCGENNNCLSLADGTPPQLKLNGVGTDPGSANGTSLDIPLTGLTFYLSLSNSGSHDANSVSISFDGPPCAGLQSPTDLVSVPAGMGLVKSATAANPVLPCPDADVNVTLSVPQGASFEPYDRVFTGTFRVHVGP